MNPFGCAEKNPRGSMKFSMYLAKRYLFSKSSTNAINIITGISVFSILAGTAVLFIVLSAFSGLKELNLSFASIVDPDLKAFPLSGKTLIITANQDTEIQQIAGIISYSKVIEERAFLEYKNKTDIGFLKGVDTQYTNVSPIENNIIVGGWPQLGEPQVIIGSGLANRLSLGVGDYTSLLKIRVPKPGTGQFTDPNQAFSQTLAVASGVFQAGESIDQEYLFGSLDFVGSLLNYDVDTISAIEFKLTEDSDEIYIREELNRILENKITLKNRTELNDALYKMLNTENVALYFICTLLVIIALFSFIGSLLMIILDKRSNIKTLSDLGATLPEIRSIFFKQGSLMIIIGGLAGILLGSLIIVIQQQFGLVRIGSLPYPVAFKIVNVFVVYITILALGLISAKVASGRVGAKLFRPTV